MEKKLSSKDLMIGDWVKCTDPKPFRIETIDEVEEQAYGDDGFYVDVADLLPIPLTSDILNANFPDTRYDVYWCWDDRKSTDNDIVFEIRIEKDDEKIVKCIRYVHELQHLLRAFDINKEITL